MGEERGITLIPIMYISITPNTEHEFYTWNYCRQSCPSAYACMAQLPYWTTRRKWFPSTAFESANIDFTLPNQENGCLVYKTTFWIKVARVDIEMKF